MEQVQLVALIIFLAAVGMIIWGRLDRTVVGIIGVALMVLFGVMKADEGFMFVDWNVIAILFGIWIIASYFGKSGIPQYLAVLMLRASRRNVAIFLTLMGVLSGFISMFVDNVVVILMMAPVVLHVTKKLKLPSFPFIIFVGLGANFMGTALLLGDLPPQMLHSVSKIEFSGFIWFMGRPSSFFILTATFLIVSFLLYQFKFRKLFGASKISDSAIQEIVGADPMHYIKNKSFALLVIILFLATILAMAFRQFIGLHLGFISITGMIALVLITEIFQKKLDSPSFEEVIGELDFRALLFYVVLFILVGGIDHVKIIQILADAMAPFFRQNLIIGGTILYWITAPIVGIVEHDAYILAFLYLIRDMAASASINPWPLWWLLLWAGTLGSNLTVAGAPALFVAQSICEKEDSCKIDIKQFFSYTVPFVVLSLIICFIFAMIVWVIPYAF